MKHYVANYKAIYSYLRAPSSSTKIVTKLPVTSGKYARTQGKNDYQRQYIVVMYTVAGYTVTYTTYNSTQYNFVLV